MEGKCQGFAVIPGAHRPLLATKFLQLLSLTPSSSKRAFYLVLQVALLPTAVSVFHRSLQFCL